jgi:beta-N-acetylhexosaminidase
MKRVLTVAAVALAAALVPVSASARIEPPMRPSPHSLAQVAYDRMSHKERIGQLLMAGVPSTGASKTQLSQLHHRTIGNVILDGKTGESRYAVKRVSRVLVSHMTVHGVAPFVSTDQEGGAVQRFAGKGFATMPAALDQGSMRPSRLRAKSRTWGRQLARAGVDLNLAPVADIVPAKGAQANQPIGRYRREYAHTPKMAAPHVGAFVKGMNSGGVDTAVKHFPGIGRATGDTDTHGHVTDPTTRHDRYLKPFRAGIDAGTQFVMISSATYPKIDRHRPACLSHTIITSMLRHDLQFHGVVMSDSVHAVALAGTPPRQRAVRFITAGGTMLLDTSMSELATLAHAIRAKAAANPRFAHLVKAAVMTNLTAKARAGLLPVQRTASTTTGA